MTSLIGYLKRNLLKFSFLVLISSITLIFPIFQNSVYSASNINVQSSAYYYLDENGKLLGNITYTFTSEDLNILSHYNTKLPFIGLTNVAVNEIGNSKKYTLFENKYSTDIDITLDQVKIRDNEKYEIQLSFTDENFLKNKTSSFTFPIALENSKDTKFTLELDKNLAKAQIIGEKNEIHQRLTQSGNLRISVDNPDKIAQIYILLGDSISYEYSLGQKLTNISQEKRLIEIPLPYADSTTLSTITSVTPTEFTTRTDTDGNILLGFSIEPNTSIDVSINGEVSLLQDSPPTTLTTSQTFAYLGTNKYWSLSKLQKDNMNSMDNIVEEFASSSSALKKTSEIKPLTEVMDEFINNNLTLDIHNTADNASGLVVARARYTAEQALNSGNITAANYSDVTMALFREYNIPSRQIVGYVSNVAGELSDGFIHTWTEYWTTDKGWIIYDPAYTVLTGANGHAKQIIDHIRLIVRSQNPVKPNTGILHDGSLSIVYTDTISSLVNNSSVTIKADNRSIVDKEALLNVTIENTGNSIINNVEVETNSKTFDNILGQQLLLPNQSFTMTLAIPIPSDQQIQESFELNSIINVKYTDGYVKLNPNKSIIKTIKPWWWDYAFLIGSSLLPIVASLGIISIYNYQRNKKK